MIYHCCEERRSAAVRRQRFFSPGDYLNGIDFLEVVDADALKPDDRQRLLRLHLINPLLQPIEAANVRIDGGERIRGIAAIDVQAAEADVVEIRLNEWGDFSRYTLRLVDKPSASDLEGAEPLAGFDVLLASIELGFKVDCPSDFDCATDASCPEKSVDEPELDYLARDYSGFRRLMLDRVTALVPEWRERHAADLGVALVELLAYAGDYLSYQQDAVATEAYLGTARRRISVRRHARLVDYRMDEGANARVWVQITLEAGVGQVTLPATPALEDQLGGILEGDHDPAKRPIRFFTQPIGMTVDGGRLVPGSPEERAALANGVEVFELAEPEPVTLFEAHDRFHFYTWGATECCLPVGATSATLAGAFPDLKKGDVLIFRELAGPVTGNPADADPRHRHAIRLAKDPVPTSDPLFNFLGDSPSGSGPAGPFPVTNIEWAVADALPFPLCISAKIGDELRGDLSVALGNIVLADHGMTVTLPDDLGEAPKPAMTRVLAGVGGHCQEPTEEEAQRRFVPPRYQPRLHDGPLIWANSVTITRDHTDLRVPYDRAAPAANAFAIDAASWPAVALAETGAKASWQPKRDLLGSAGDAAEFVVEVDDDGVAAIRFGDDLLGRRPNRGDAFAALYRIGDGPANIGAESIKLIVSPDPAIVAATNPLPARGGRRPETIEEVRQRAPVAFRTQERAVSLADYADVAQRHPEVQRAVASFRWTGSWRTVFVTVDRTGGRELTDVFRDELKALFERYRMAGHDVEIDSPVFVPLELELTVCARPDYFRSDVKAALLERFSNRVMADGRPGIFHPDELTFGQTIFLSRLYAAAQAIPGVESVEITTFQRQGIPSQAAIQSGELTLGRFEIPRLDNDPNFPDRGVFRPTVGGGK
jgi:hypothetical protein